MASTESAQKVRGNNDRLPFYSQYDCEGSSGTDVLAQDVSRLPGKGERMFGYCSPPSKNDRRYSPAFGGMAGPRGDRRAGYPDVLVPSRTTRIHPIYRRGAERCEGSLPAA